MNTYIYSHYISKITIIWEKSSILGKLIGMGKIAASVLLNLFINGNEKNVTPPHPRPSAWAESNSNDIQSISNTYTYNYYVSRFLCGVCKVVLLDQEYVLPANVRVDPPEQRDAPDGRAHLLPVDSPHPPLHGLPLQVPQLYLENVGWILGYVMTSCTIMLNTSVTSEKRCFFFSM